MTDVNSALEKWFFVYLQEDSSSDGAQHAPESSDESDPLHSDAVAPEDEDEEGLMDEEEELDEVNGYHFVNCTTLFVAYIYVNSGASAFHFL